MVPFKICFQIPFLRNVVKGNFYIHLLQYDVIYINVLLKSFYGKHHDDRIILSFFPEP